MNIRVTPEQLDTISSQLKSGASNIDSILNTLKSQVAPLGSDWAGGAQSQYLHLWQEWEKASRDLHHALTQISQMTHNAANAYRQADQQIGSSFNLR